MVLFSLLYGIISLSFAYYGEMITYLCMTMPMAIVALVAWLKNPYEGNRAEVRVNRLCRRDILLLCALTVPVTAAFYFAFLLNDIYGFLCWQKMKRRQEK